MMQGARANILDAVGGTPLVRLQRVVPADLHAELYAKCEFLNPAGSVKDRAALHLVLQAEGAGRLRPGGTLVAATHGSAGASLAMVAAVRGYRCVFVVPDKVSAEKLAALRAWGARVVVCPAEVGPDDPRSHHAVARRIADETPNAWLCDQHHNPGNPEAHALHTGPELWTQTGGALDAVVAPLDTGGTLSGIGRFLKAQQPAVRVVGVDAVGSVYFDHLQRAEASPAFRYQLEGVGGEFVPDTLHRGVIDACVRVDDRTAFLTARELVRREGLFVGGSSGAAVAGAIAWARSQPVDGARGPLRVVVVLPDGAEGYLSKVFHDDWMRAHGYIDPEPALGTVRALLQHRPQTVVTASSDDTLRRVVAKMKSLGISQLPVVDGGRLRGVVSEVDVLRNLVSGEAHLDGTIAGIFDPAYAEVTPDTPIDQLQAVLAEARVALVTDGPRLLGLISKIDLIDYLARRAAES